MERQFFTSVVEGDERQKFAFWAAAPKGTKSAFGLLFFFVSGGGLGTHGRRRLLLNARPRNVYRFLCPLS